MSEFAVKSLLTAGLHWRHNQKLCDVNLWVWNPSPDQISARRLPSTPFSPPSGRWKQTPVRTEATVARIQIRAVWTLTRSCRVSIRIGKKSWGLGRTPAGCLPPTSLSTPGQVQTALGLPTPETDPGKRWRGTGPAVQEPVSGGREVSTGIMVNRHSPR